MSAASLTQEKRVVPIPSARLLSRVEAAGYVGVSPTTFDKLVRDRIMPQAKRLYSRTLWDVRALDVAIDALPGDDTAADANPWD